MLAIECLEWHSVWFATLAIQKKNNFSISIVQSSISFENTVFPDCIDSISGIPSDEEQ